ncbi:hypothetical protein [Sorangium cellulosum]|nr:hypothetical protein [Sorangium cellulosum]
MNGLVSGGGTLSSYAGKEALLEAALRALDGQAKAPLRPKAFPGFGQDTNDTAQAGWVLIVPDDDEGRRIAAALAPLVEHRLRVRDNTAFLATPPRPEDAVKYFPATSREPPALHDWVNENIAFVQDAPFYVLVAGPPAKIPFELDHQIRVRDQAVGRLAFPDVESYRSYAAKVVAWEPDDDAKRTPRVGLPVGVFATDHGYGDPTRLSRAFLVDPVVAHLRSKDPSRPIVRRDADEASREALLGLLRGGDPGLAGPRLLFSASHGLAVPGEGEVHRIDRLRRQGAICCQDGKYLEDEILTAEALGGGAFLQGGIWVLFACFGGGTPRASDFFQALGDRSLLRFYDGGPFVAALPTRLLANPDGPLAVIGHLDPGFIHSFSDPRGVGGERRTKIQKLIELLLHGFRASVATGPLYGAANGFGEQARQSYSRVASQLASAAGGASYVETVKALAAADPESELGKLRDQLVDVTVSLYDFRNFTILGDPAVKLPAAGARPARAARSFGAASAAVADSGLPAPIAEAQREGRLVLATTEELFSEKGIPLAQEGTTVIALVAAPCADVRERPAAEEKTPEGRRRRYYEAVEHQDCDWQAEIRLPPNEASLAPQVRLLLANGVRLRYGEAISLFGDFYGIPGVAIGAGEGEFLKVFDTFEGGERAEMCRILGVMGRERVVVEEAPSGGQGAAAAYERAGGDLNGSYNRATGGGSLVSALLPQGRFLRLAAANYDHFAFDARAAYRAGHAAACRQAAQARADASPGERRRLLERAYLMNACADHFLTDLFAAGHLRVPRRALATQVSPKLAGDLLAKRMHDEDNARGLVVRNRRGDTWRAYGDKYFHAEGHEDGRQLAREAVRASAAEVWAAFDGGAAPAFAALDVVPDIGEALASTDNHAPLFVVHDGALKIRERLADLECREWTSDFTGVGALLRAISHGGI